MHHFLFIVFFHHIVLYLFVSLAVRLDKYSFILTSFGWFVCFYGCCYCCRRLQQLLEEQSTACNKKSRKRWKIEKNDEQIQFKKWLILFFCYHSLLHFIRNDLMCIYLPYSTQEHCKYIPQTTYTFAYVNIFIWKRFSEYKLAFFAIVIFRLFFRR